MDMINWLKNVSQWGGVLFAGLVTSDAIAANCAPYNNAPFVYTHNLSFNSTQNYIGYERAWVNYERGGTFNVPAPCPTSSHSRNTYITLKPGAGMVFSHKVGSINWYDIPENDYLQVATEVYIGGSRKRFYPTPTTGQSNGCSSLSCSPNYATGSRVRVKMRIKKKFIGESFLVNREIANIFFATSASDRPTRPVSIIRMSYKFTVPQSCSFDVGDVIEFDLGQIQASGFEAAGAGNVPDGAATMTKNIGISCKGIEAQEMLSARVESANPLGTNLSSNNKDVGFQILDQYDQVLIPNNINSFIPFKLDENARSNFILKARAISLTGLKPKLGPVSSQGHVRIDFR